MLQRVKEQCSEASCSKPGFGSSRLPLLLKYCNEGQKPAACCHLSHVSMRVYLIGDSRTPSKEKAPRTKHPGFGYPLFFFDQAKLPCSLGFKSLTAQARTSTCQSCEPIDFPRSAPGEKARCHNFGGPQNHGMKAMFPRSGISEARSLVNRFE